MLRGRVMKSRPAPVQSSRSSFVLHEHVLSQSTTTDMATVFPPPKCQREWEALLGCLQEKSLTACNTQFKAFIKCAEYYSKGNTENV